LSESPSLYQYVIQIGKAGNPGTTLYKTVTKFFRSVFSPNIAQLRISTELHG